MLSNSRNDTVLYPTYAQFKNLSQSSFLFWCTYRSYIHLAVPCAVLSFGVRITVAKGQICPGTGSFYLVAFKTPSYLLSFAPVSIMQTKIKLGITQATGNTTCLKSSAFPRKSHPHIRHCLYRAFPNGWLLWPIICNFKAFLELFITIRQNHMMQFEALELDCKSVSDVKIFYYILFLLLRALQETKRTIYITSLNSYKK